MSGTKYGNVQFSNENGWPDKTDHDINVSDYPGIIKDSLYGENGYEKYLKKIINNISVRLLTKSESDNLGCNKTCTDAPAWLYSTSYWLQTTCPDGKGVYNVGSYGYPGSDNFNPSDSNFGVRPVISFKK